MGLSLVMGWHDLVGLSLTPLRNWVKKEVFLTTNGSLPHNCMILHSLGLSFPIHEIMEINLSLEYGENTLKSGSRGW